VTVRGNTVFGAPLGIFLHNASSITVEGNRLWLPTMAALAGSMDQLDADWMRDNRWIDNEIVPLVQARTAAGAAPVIGGSQAVWLWHSLHGEATIGAGRNAFAGNVVLSLQGARTDHAWLRSPTGERYVDADAWRRLNAGTEPMPLQPLRFDPLLLTLGPELAIGGGFDAALVGWGHYADPSGSGLTLQPVSGVAGCTGGCMRMTSGARGDLLGSAPFMLRQGSQYVYRWTAIMPSHSGATVAPPYVSRHASPWDVMAVGDVWSSFTPRIGMASEAVSYEAFFTAKESAQSRINIQLETLRVPVTFDNVSLREVLASSAAQTADWAALAYAPAGTARSVGCAELGWPAGCTAVGSDGAPVPLPLVLAAGTQRLLLRADSPLRR
jgi:hypothetical protein